MAWSIDEGLSGGKIDSDRDYRVATEAVKSRGRLRGSPPTRRTAGPHEAAQLDQTRGGRESREWLVVGRSHMRRPSMTIVDVALSGVRIIRNPSHEVENLGTFALRTRCQTTGGGLWKHRKWTFSLEAPSHPHAAWCATRGSGDQITADAEPLRETTPAMTQRSQECTLLHWIAVSWPRTGSARSMWRSRNAGNLLPADAV